MDRAPIVVGISASIGVVAWVLVGGGDSEPKARAPGSGDRADPRAATRAPEGPALPAASGWGTAAMPKLPTPPAAPAADDVFLEEIRDDAWATKTERDISERWKAIRGGKLESAECRRAQCRLVITGAEADIGQAIADLEGPRGMQGFANHVHLTNPAHRADGSIALRVFVRFER